MSMMEINAEVNGEDDEPFADYMYVLYKRPAVIE